MSPSSSWSRSAIASHAMGLSSGSGGPGPRLGAAHLDPSVAGPRREHGLRVVGGPADDAPVPQIEAGIVQRAGDHAARRPAPRLSRAPAWLQRSSRAYSLAVGAVQQHLPALDLDPDRAAVRELGVGDRTDPAARAGGRRHPVDHDRPALHQVPADEARRPPVAAMLVTPSARAGRRCPVSRAASDAACSATPAVLSRPWNSPTRRSSPSLTVQSVMPVATVPTAAARPAALSVAAGSIRSSPAGTSLPSRSSTSAPDQKPIGRSLSAVCTECPAHRPPCISSTAMLLAVPVVERLQHAGNAAVERLQPAPACRSR